MQYGRIIELLFADPKKRAFLITYLAYISELCVNLGPFRQSPTANTFLLLVIIVSLT